MTHVECSYDPCSSNFIDNVNDNTGATVFARAKHSFEGRNNDEVYFNIFFYSIFFFKFHVFLFFSFHIFLK